MFIILLKLKHSEFCSLHHGENLSQYIYKISITKTRHYLKLIKLLKTNLLLNRKKRISILIFFLC